MEIDYIKAHMMIERYVQGNLSDDEVVAFEERLLWDQSLQEDVDLAEAMQNWLKASAEESKFTISETRRAPRWIPDFLLNPGYAAAASFVLGLIVAFPILRSPQQGTEFVLDESAPSIVIPLLATRSADNEPTSVPITPGAVTLLLVDVPFLDESFNIVVRRSAGGEAVWTQSGLSAGFLDAIAVGLPAAAVPPGRYILAIESIGNAGFRQEFSFQTVMSK
jgi:hypothetical protein